MPTKKKRVSFIPREHQDQWLNDASKYFGVTKSVLVAEAVSYLRDELLLQPRLTEEIKERLGNEKSDG